MPTCTIPLRQVIIPASNFVVQIWIKDGFREQSVEEMSL